MYNKFVDEQPELIEEDYTKEELHQRVDDLCCELYNISSEKKNQAKDELLKIIKSGFIELEMEIFVNKIASIVQSEVNRYY
jgi:hypothetical protein